MTTRRSSLDSCAIYGNTVTVMVDSNCSSLRLPDDGIDIRYTRSGFGDRVIVLLHGTASSLEHFDSLVPLLDPNWDVIRMDLPGFGCTGPRPDRDYRIRTYARTVSRFLRELNIPRYTILGNSLGGNIAFDMALDQPDRIEALVLVNATGYPLKTLPKGMQLARKPWARPILRRWLPRSAVERSLSDAVGPGSSIVDGAMITRVHRMWSKPGNKSAFVDFVNTDQVDRTGQLGSITSPTLVLTSGSMPQGFASDIPGAVERIHPDGGHLLPEEQPDWVADAVAEFFHRPR